MIDSDDARSEPLVPITGLAGESLALVKPSWRRREYELGTDDALVGRLHGPKVLRSGAEAEAADGAWHFAPRGFWRRRIEVAEATTGSEVAMLRRSGMRGDGSITLGGETFALRRRSWWKGDWVLEEGETEHIRLRSRQGRKRRVEVELAAESERLRPLALLVLLGCYLVIANDDENAAAAGAAAGA